MSLCDRPGLNPPPDLTVFLYFEIDNNNKIYKRLPELQKSNMSSNMLQIPVAKKKEATEIFRCPKSQLGDTHSVNISVFGSEKRW